MTLIDRPIDDPISSRTTDRLPVRPGGSPPPAAVTSAILALRQRGYFWLSYDESLWNLFVRNPTNSGSEM